MTNDMNKNVGSHFYLNGRFCEITIVTSFGGVNHYGFQTVDDGKWTVGWVPSEMVTLH